VNLLFGSQVLDPETGIILNDEMDDFSTPGQPNAFGLYPSPYNYPAPFKRPLSSTVPAIVEGTDGEFELAIGGSGGSRIFGAVFMTLLNLVSGRDGDILGAVERGRVHDQLFPALVDADDTVTEEEIGALWEKGHNVSVSSRGGVKAVVNAVMRGKGTVYGE
jgi:gamma-glutamyltranspeptidase/glutathione hydrolase/leukotriene-C4 hydrolase